MEDLISTQVAAAADRGALRGVPADTPNLALRALAAPAPTRAPTAAPTAPRTCFDRDGWSKKGAPSKGCAWVAKVPGDRCAVKGDESYAWQSCPATCGTCAYDCADAGDAPTWHKRGDEAKGCAWVANYFYNRAAVVGADGAPAYERCPAATRRCAYGGCGDDSASWRKAGQPWKDCAWAAAAASRCVAVGDDGAYGFEACPAACLACAARYDGCGDAESWHKKNAPAKDCAWVARDAGPRCAVKGGDGAWAWQSCPAACGIC